MGPAGTPPGASEGCPPVGRGTVEAVLAIDGREVAVLAVARTRRARSRGLLGRDGLDGALWLPGVRSVHTVGMRFPLDVAWVDGRGRVRHVARLPPGRLSAWRRAAGVLEAEAGSFARWGLVPGARLDGLAPSGGRRPARR